MNDTYVPKNEMTLVTAIPPHIVTAPKKQNWPKRRTKWDPSVNFSQRFVHPHHFKPLGKSLRHPGRSQLIFSRGMSDVVVKHYAMKMRFRDVTTGTSGVF